MSTPAKRLDLKRAKALLVDDNPQSLELLSQVLTGFRMREMKTCRDVTEAKDILVTQRFDLILIDLDMPGEDGLSLVRHIRSEHQLPNYTAPIMILHGFTPAFMVSRARDAGANMVVRKPIAPSILLSRIEWIARNDREFVAAENYHGPDRRFRQVPLSEDCAERRADALALVADPTRALSQDDISALFG
ncbi:response regulator [uncultured Brevundimonas sp.]|uniref:response regulator n=1 Tax=uncultured Brevundimonas sp. TaxID=213418 RepID=UPI0030EF5FB0|tara:strand:+ start:64 stop:633 length:570 start_codon:yes stop_codon:yes gene_type:complete